MAGLSLLVLVLLVAAIIVAFKVSGGAGGEPFVVPPATAPVNGIQPAGAAAAVQRLQQAVRGGDQAAARALAPAGDDAAAARLAALVDAAVATHLVDVSFRYVDETGGLDVDQDWAAAIDTTWEFAGFDQAPARSEVGFAFRATAQGVRIADVGVAGLRTPVWMSGSVQVHRTVRTLVIVAGDHPIDPYVGFADRAVPIVHRVVTTWKPRLVVEVPADLAALDQALDEQPGANAAIAALASSVDGASSPDTPVHILVNPDVFDPLPRLGAQVVMSHEVTHVATNAYLSQAPTWLKEGIADFVALRDVPLPLTRTAAQIRAQVRADGPPHTLPTAAQFDPQAPHLGAVYEAAWLVCVTLADRAGQAALLSFYDRTSAGADLGPTLMRLFGWSVTDLLGAWQSRLSGLAHGA